MQQKSFLRNKIIFIHSFLPHNFLFLETKYGVLLHMLFVSPTIWSNPTPFKPNLTGPPSLQKKHKRATCVAVMKFGLSEQNLIRNILN